MSNYNGSIIYYKPRMTDLEANDALPEVIREALNYAITSWDSYWVLRYYRKRCKQGGWPSDIAKEVALQIKTWDKSFVMKGWIKARGRRKASPSSAFICNVPILYNERL